MRTFSSFSSWWNNGWDCLSIEVNEHWIGTISLSTWSKILSTNMNWSNEVKWSSQSNRKDLNSEINMKIFEITSMSINKKRKRTKVVTCLLIRTDKKKSRLSIWKRTRCDNYSFNFVQISIKEIQHDDNDQITLNKEKQKRLKLHNKITNLKNDFNEKKRKETFFCCCS